MSNIDKTKLTDEEANAGIGQPPVVPRNWESVLKLLRPNLPIRSCTTVLDLLAELTHTDNQLKAKIKNLEDSILRARREIDSCNMDRLLLARLVSLYDLPNRYLEKEKKVWWLNDEGNDLRINLNEIRKNLDLK